MIALWFALATCVSAYRVFLNINQFPSTMVTQSEQWATLQNSSDGMFGIGAPHPWLPMDLDQRRALIGAFASKRQVIISTFEAFMASPGSLMARAAHENFSPTRTFMWAAGGALLLPEQLDEVQATNMSLGPVFVNARGWTQDREQVVASILHPWCRGVVIEGNPLALTKPILRLNERMQIAQFVVQNTNKTLFFQQPPIHDLTTAEPLVDQVSAMLRTLHDVLGPAMCTRRVVLVPSAYTTALNSNTSMPFLPETSLDTYTGLALYIIREGARSCAGL